MQISMVLIFILTLASPANADQRWFDWNRYHDRLGACLEQDRIAALCTRGLDWCDELALRQARRACSAFGPLRDRWR
jgi:hypothetical protein